MSTSKSNDPGAMVDLAREIEGLSPEQLTDLVRFMRDSTARVLYAELNEAYNYTCPQCAVRCGCGPAVDGVIEDDYLDVEEEGVYYEGIA